MQLESKAPRRTTKEPFPSQPPILGCGQLLKLKNRIEHQSSLGCGGDMVQKNAEKKGFRTRKPGLLPLPTPKRHLKKVSSSNKMASYRKRAIDRLTAGP